MLKKMSRVQVVALTLFVFALAGFFFMANGFIPKSAAALGLPSMGGPFAGNVKQVKFCQGGLIYAEVQTPFGGTKKVIWTPGTKTHDYGPIKRPGQWVLGMLGGKENCILGPKQMISGEKIIILGTGS